MDFRAKVCQAITSSISVQSCWLLSRNVAHSINWIRRSRGDIWRKSCYPYLHCHGVLSDSIIKTSLTYYFINISWRWGRWDTMTMASYSYSFHHAAILGWYEEFSHRISLVHNFVNILPLSTIVAFPCSLLRSLSATETLARWELWGRRYCYWRPVAAAMVRRSTMMVCVVCCCNFPPPLPSSRWVFCTNSTIRRKCHVDSIDLSNTNYSYLQDNTIQDMTLVFDVSQRLIPYWPICIQAFRASPNI